MQYTSSLKKLFVTHHAVRATGKRVQRWAIDNDLEGVVSKAEDMTPAQLNDLKNEIRRETEEFLLVCTLKPEWISDNAPEDVKRAARQKRAFINPQNEVDPKNPNLAVKFDRGAVERNYTDTDGNKISFWDRLVGMFCPLLRDVTKPQREAYEAEQEEKRKQSIKDAAANIMNMSHREVELNDKFKSGEITAQEYIAALQEIHLPAAAK